MPEKKRLRSLWCREQTSKSLRQRSLRSLEQERQEGPIGHTDKKRAREITKAQAEKTTNIQRK